MADRELTRDTVLLWQKDLKPCPFCGREPFIGQYETGWYAIMCGCGVDGAPDLGISGAVARWNERVDDV